MTKARLVDSKHANWVYEETSLASHPHGIHFWTCANSGVHRYAKSPIPHRSGDWIIIEHVEEWLNQNVGKRNWYYQPLVPYVVSFKHKHHAALFKLTFSSNATP